MIFRVAEPCRQLGLRVNAVICRGVKVADRSDLLRDEIAREVQAIVAKYPTPQAVQSLAEIISFQEILRQVNVNPRKVQSSLERLLNFVVKRRDLPTVNNFVDAYNLASIRWHCSLGAHDVDRITLPIALRPLTGRETFTPLGRVNMQALIAGEFGYVDADDRVLCRLDVQQADFSKVTTKTTTALLIIEGTRAHRNAHLEETVANTIDLVTRHCGGMAELVEITH